jgi:hypothetical protein
MINSGQAAVHPITGLTAIGIKKDGSYIWPVMGGDETIEPPVPGQAEPLIEGANPAWNDFLRYVPEDKRPEVVPFFQQRDKDVQERIQKVHSEYEPWKEFVKTVDPETAQFAVEVLAKMQEDPRSVYDSLGEHFGWTNGNGSTEPPEPGQGSSGTSQQIGDPNFDLEQHPAFQQLAQRNEVLANIMLAQHRSQQEEAAEFEADAELDAEFEEAEKKYGKFDKQAEDFVEMFIIANDVSVDEAAQAYFKFIEGIGGNRRPPPRLHGGSGGGAVPTPKVNVKNMSDKEAKDMFAQMIMDSQRG